MELARPGTDGSKALEKQLAAKRQTLEKGRLSSTLSADRQYALNKAAVLLEEERALLLKEQPGTGDAAFKLLKADFDKRTKALKLQAEETGKKLSNLFRFAEDAFPEGQELLILVTELTVSAYGARFISRYGCKEYFDHNKELLFYERQREIVSQLGDLDL